MRWKKLLVGLSISLITLMLLAAGSEIFLRVTKVANYETGKCYQSDPILHHKTIPNTSCTQKTDEWLVEYKNNSYGFRNPEFKVEKEPGTFRILLLGDSFPYGTGVPMEKTFPRLLENKLNEHYQGKPKIEVINAAVASYSPIIHYLYMINEGLKLNPDLVLLEYDLTDFVNELEYDPMAEYKDGKPVGFPGIVQKETQTVTAATSSAVQVVSDEKALPFVPSNVKAWLHNHSVLYAFLATQIKMIRNIPLAEEVKTQEGTYFQIVGDDGSKDEKLYEGPKKNLKLIADFLKEKNIKFVLSAHPWGMLVSEKEWDTGRLRQGLLRNKVYSARYFDELDKFSQENGIQFINLLPAFKESKNFPLFYPFDGHFTEKGHEVTAEGLSRSIINATIAN